MSERRLRVLCFHGWRTNAKVMEDQTKAIQRELGDKAEFICLDGPMQERGPAQELVQQFYGHLAPFRQWWEYQEEKDANGETIRTYDGMDAAMEYVTDKLEELGPFDVLLGFSQGAAMISLLQALFDKSYLPIPWKMVVLVGGVKPFSKQADELLTKSDGSEMTLRIPSVHVMGKTDPYFKYSEMIRDIYANDPEAGLKRVELVHEEGHKFPSAKRYPELYKTLANEILDTCSGSKNNVKAAKA